MLPLGKTAPSATLPPTSSTPSLEEKDKEDERNGHVTVHSGRPDLGLAMRELVEDSLGDSDVVG